MNFLKEYRKEVEAAAIKYNLVYWLKMKRCSHHTVIKHRHHDGCDRFQCTDCGNIEVKPIK